MCKIWYNVRKLIKNGDSTVKKFIALLLVLTMCLTSCALSKDKLDDIDALKNLIGNENEKVDAPTHNHNFEAVVLNPSCESGGYTLYDCGECGYYYVSDHVDPLGHTVVTLHGKAPTADESGLSEGSKCSVCGKVFVQQTTIPPTGHNYTTTVTEPTCTSGGYTTYTCTDCDSTFTADETSPLPHTEVAIPGKTATCTEAGLTDGKQCTVCLTFTVKQETVVAKGHTWTPATTEAPKTCKVCGTTEGDKLTQNQIPTLTVSYIDVGQGDSIFIKVGDCDILIDAGYAEYGSTVSSYLKKQGVDDIELMINTHPDADHCGGLTQVLRDFVVEEVWISKDTNKNTAAYKNFVSAIGNEELTAKQPNKGTVYTYEYLTLTVLYSAKGSDTNNSSIVVMLEYGGFKFLFTGDIGEEVETQLVSSGADLKCDVLKVGHHGSKYSSTAAFLKATGAEYGVICVGNNDYGHPTSAALSRLSSAGISIYRTDLVGNIVFSTNGAELTLPDGSKDTTGTLPSVASTLSGMAGYSIPKQYCYIVVNLEETVFLGKKSADYSRKCA